MHVTYCTYRRPWFFNDLRRSGVTLLLTTIDSFSTTMSTCHDQLGLTLAIGGPNHMAEIDVLTLWMVTQQLVQFRRPSNIVELRYFV